MMVVVMMMTMTCYLAPVSFVYLHHLHLICCCSWSALHQFGESVCLHFVNVADPWFLYSMILVSAYLVTRSSRISLILIVIFSGEDESQYWNKMFRDREQKLSNNIRVKQRGRDKILRRAERELGKHIRFDD
jgi:hypothetical protein